ncbi:MAG TPA: hypothetical protein VIK91_09535 [Nannocystis sp.]
MTQNTNTPAPQVTTLVVDEITGEHIVLVPGALHYGDMAGGGTVVHVSVRSTGHRVAVVRRY